MARYRLVSERSQVWTEARSTLHPIHVETAGLEGYLEADVDGEEVRLGVPTRVELDVALLKSNNALLDGELRRRLEARRFPRITGELLEAKPAGNGRSVLRGELSLHGVKRELDVEVVARATPEGTLQVDGEKVIDMRDFGLDPPKILFLKVDPRVRIRARLVASLEQIPAG